LGVRRSLGFDSGEGTPQGRELFIRLDRIFRESIFDASNFGKPAPPNVAASTPRGAEIELTQLWRSTDSGKAFAAVTSAEVSQKTRAGRTKTRRT
jgi:hypothetical protein